MDGEALRFQQTVPCAPALHRLQPVLDTCTGDTVTNPVSMCMCVVLQFLCCEVAHQQERGLLSQMTVWSVADFYLRLQCSSKVHDAMMDAEGEQQVGIK